MPSKKDNLPVSVDVDLENGGTIKYANEVIAIIAGVAASEVDGIAGMCASGMISDILGRNRSITRGVKVEIGTEEASVELYIVVEYGSPIQKVASDVQENVRKAIETMTGLHVVNVNVHVQGVSFEKEKKALQSGLESAHLSGADTERIENATRESLREEKEEAARAQAEADRQAAPDNTSAAPQDAAGDDASAACDPADGESAPPEDAQDADAPSQDAPQADASDNTPPDDAPEGKAKGRRGGKRKKA